ncbi:nitroreductase/quinone reductase family protein [Actinomycetes bacterium KLBMP 9797]
MRVPMSGFNQQIIDEFRAHGGRVGGMFEGADLVLLTTVGARSGTPRTSPVGYARDGDRILVFGSNAGQDRHPDWYHNLLANPRVTVEVGTETFAAFAVPVRGAERDRLYAEQGARVPAYAAYQEQTVRVIPVVALYRTERDGGRAAAIGDQLVRIHQELRQQLAAVRAGARTGGVDVRQHCLAFCGALHAHHTNEDGAFPGIEERIPELAPVLDRLRREHTTVAGHIRRIQELLATEGDVRADLDRLAAELEEHFAYEEHLLVPALNQLTSVS